MLQTDNSSSSHDEILHLASSSNQPIPNNVKFNRRDPFIHSETTVDGEYSKSSDIVAKSCKVLKYLTAFKSDYRSDV